MTKTADPLNRGVVASFKTSTTEDVTDGIEAAVKKVLNDAGVDPTQSDIFSLTIGTTVRRTHRISIYLVMECSIS